MLKQLATLLPVASTMLPFLATMSNVASTLLLVWTGLKAAYLWVSLWRLLAVCDILWSLKVLHFINSHRAGVRSIVISRSVCPYVCPLAFLKTHTCKIHQIFYTLPVAVARSSSDRNARCYLLLVLWMTSCSRIMDRIGQNQRRRVCFVQFAWWRTPGRNLSSPTVSC